MKLFYLVAFLFSTFTLNSQSLHFESAGLKDMPSSEVYQAFQDSHGLIWLATDAGLCRFDGNSVTTYTVKDGISENVILKIYEDHLHRIWFSTLSGYFFYYENGKFTQIDANKHTGNSFKSFGVASFLIGENDTLYYTVASVEGLMKIPPENNYSKIIHQFKVWNSSTRYIIPNKNGTEYLTGGGLVAPNFKDSTYSLYFLDTLISVSFKNIRNSFSYNLFNPSITKNGTLYLPIRNQVAILSKGKAIQYHNFPDNVLKVLQDKDGDMWICIANHGGYIFKGGNMKSRPLHFLDTLSVSSILFDKEGTVWATTLEKGVFQCMNKYVLSIPDAATTLTTDDSQLTISFASKKIGVISTTDSLTYIPPPANLQKGEVPNTYLRTKNSIYYGTSNDLYYITNNKIISVKGDPRSPIIPKKMIFSGGDTLLAITNYYLITLLNGKKLRFLRQLFPLNCIVKLANKKILIGSRNNIGIVEFKNNMLLPYLGHLKELKTRINNIEEDANGNIWIATNERGVYCYNPFQKKLYNFNEESGLRSNKVNSCTSDSGGNIWCGTQIGITKLNTSNGLDKVSIQNFNESHGVFDLEINAIQEFNGKIYCAAKTAFFYFEADKLQINRVPPNVYVQSLYINDQATPISDNFHLNYNQNNFHLQFKLISYKTSTNKRFYYTLSGYDERWYLSNSGDINYTNIKYGTYPLVVYGINNDGVYSSKPDIITFIIKKPFWFTWWFIAIEIILFSVIIYSTMRFWKSKIEKREHEKMMNNNRIAEFKMTALRSQMNPHFIFNALGSIQHYNLKNDVKNSNKYLAKFASLIRNILTNSREEYIALSQEIATLQLYVELEQICFTEPFEFIVEIDDELDMDIDIPTMLIQPYIENSIWHGLVPKKSAGILHLIFKEMDSHILVIIKDNGVGRKPKNDSLSKHVSMGMSITEQRIKLLESTSEKKFEIKIIDLKDEHNFPIGTEVNILIPIER